MNAIMFELYLNEQSRYFSFVLTVNLQRRFCLNIRPLISKLEDIPGRNWKLLCAN